MLTSTTRKIDAANSGNHRLHLQRGELLRAGVDHDRLRWTRDRYDHHLRRQWKSDPQNNGPRSDVTDNTAFTYDSERRVLSRTDALGKIVHTAYDADGQVVRISAQIGATWLATCTTYTSTGKRLRVWGPAIVATNLVCPTAAAPVSITDFTYDTLERARLVTRYLTVAEGGNRITEFSYGNDDQVTLSNVAP